MSSWISINAWRLCVPKRVVIAVTYVTIKMMMIYDLNPKGTSSLAQVKKKKTVVLKEA